MTSSDYRKLSALLSAMKDGAREAFAEVYSMYEKKVYFLCCKILCHCFLMFKIVLSQNWECKDIQIN